MRRLCLAATALALAAAGLALTAPDSDGRVRAAYDFGDAPDGGAAGYAGNADVTGRFPARAASGGPRHTLGPRLGRSWNGEAASRQVDADVDDGARLDARPCATSTLSIVLDARRAAPGAAVYVNAWFDWNQDGDWADGAGGSCGPEWGVQNYLVQPGALDDGIVTLELRFRAGRVPDQFWWRVQVQAGRPAPHAAGGGQAAPTPGETEDRLFSQPRTVTADLVDLICSPAAGVLLHGGGHDLYAWLGGTSGRAVSIQASEVRLRGDARGVLLGPEAVVANAVRIRVRSTTRRLPRTLQSLSVEVEVTATVDGEARGFRVGCPLLIAHTRRVAPPPLRQPRLGPAPTALPGSGTAAGPGAPTPATARCAGDLVRGDAFGYFFADTACAGIDIKSTTYWASGVAIAPIGAFNAASGGFLDRCEDDPAADSLTCLWKPGNKGRTVTYVFAPVTFPRRVTLTVLAGGTGTAGSTVVLRQDYSVLEDGSVRCAQPVPRAARCAKAATG